MKGELMKTYIAYFDETGDDGVTINSSDHFILTSLYMPAESWQQNFEKMRILRRELKDKYGFHVSEEMHTKHFLTDKNPYREYHWSKETKQDIIKAFTLTIAKMDLKIVNVIIDKKKFKDNNYHVLENALKYNIQRIENDSDGQWNYLVITDEGRIAPMRKTAVRMQNCSDVISGSLSSIRWPSCSASSTSAIRAISQGTPVSEQMA